MFAEQSGGCAICREAKAEHVDHDHATGRVRGLLCFNCNGALGQFRDRTDLMLPAVEYTQVA
jgi:recombination endonuclease VII